MNKTDLGFFAIKLENNTFHDKICSLIDGYISNNHQSHIVMFNHICEKIETKQIPLLPISYAKYFKGDLVVFDIASLLVAVDCININRVYFYAQNMPWINSYNDYSDWEYLFKNDKIKIIANNEHLHNIYNIVWNNSLGVSEDITYDKFSKFI